MKYNIKVIFLIFISLLIHIPNAYSQVQCPMNIEDVKNDSQFVKSYENDYEYVTVFGDNNSKAIWCEYGNTGILSIETNFLSKNSKVIREGIKKIYHESGKIKVEMPYKDDKVEGIAKFYYENGKLKYEMPYKDDKVEGIAKSYYEGGKLKNEEPYKDGKREGIKKSYNEDGRLSQETPYVNDLQEGKMKSYRKNGKMFATIIYEKDKPISGICNHTNGGTSSLTNAELTNWENGLSIECN